MLLKTTIQHNGNPIQHGLTPSRQKGQAIILILLLTVAAVLIGLSLVNMGIMTSEKMQLQNAADATAYSVSVTEARDLNFTAYTNRAMIANEVAMGQMVGLMSHASMITSIPAWLDTYFTLIGVYAIPVAGQIIKGIVQGFATGLGKVKQTTKKFLKIPVTGIFYFNKFYSTAQRVMHLGTLYFSMMTLWEVPDKNIDDAQFSIFGYLALFRHLTTYYPDLKLGYPEAFVTSYRQDDRKKKLPYIPHTPLNDEPSSDAQKEGMQRLAALINASRDPYSKNRQCSGHPFYGKGGIDICDEDLGGFAMNFIDLHPRLTIPFGVGEVELGLDFTIGLRRHGGTDLRYKEIGDDNRYIWTASDQIGMAVTLGIVVRLEVFGFTIIDVDESFTASAPFGVGGGQIAKVTDQVLPFPDLTMFPTDMGGQVEGDFYGNNPGQLPTIWFVMIPGLNANALPPSLATFENNLYTNYEGLPRYNDTKRGPDEIQLGNPLKVGWGLEAPYFLVALEKDMDNISQSESTGRFKLDPNAAADKIAVIAKSEVYFSRPNDISHFARGDGATELANAFNPYWDARLVDTSYIDRTMALAIDQQQWWLSKEIQATLTSLKNLLDSILP